MSDAAELEREAEAARARLSETADQLKARMSPGQLMDEVLNQFRDGDGNQMLSNLRTQARDNPMALALVGSGLAWLMMGSGPSAPRAPGAPAGTTAYLRQPPSGAAHAGRSGEAERQHLGSTGEALRDRASTLLDQGVAAAKDAAGEVYETVRDEADRQGLVPDDRPISEKIDAVVRAAGATAGEIAEKHVAALEGDEKKREAKTSRS